MSKRLIKSLNFFFLGFFLACSDSTEVTSPEKETTLEVQKTTEILPVSEETPELEENFFLEANGAFEQILSGIGISSVESFKFAFAKLELTHQKLLIEKVFNAQERYSILGDPVESVLKELILWAIHSIDTFDVYEHLEFILRLEKCMELLPQNESVGDYFLGWLPVLHQEDQKNILNSFLEKYAQSIRLKSPNEKIYSKLFDKIPQSIGWELDPQSQKDKIQELFFIINQMTNKRITQLDLDNFGLRDKILIGHEIYKRHQISVNQNFSDSYFLHQTYKYLKQTDPLLNKILDDYSFSKWNHDWLENSISVFLETQKFGYDEKCLFFYEIRMLSQDPFLEDFLIRKIEENLPQQNSKLYDWLLIYNHFLDKKIVEKSLESILIKPAQLFSNGLKTMQMNTLSQDALSLLTKLYHLSPEKYHDYLNKKIIEKYNEIKKHSTHSANDLKILYQSLNSVEETTIQKSPSIQSKSNSSKALDSLYQYLENKNKNSLGAKLLDKFKDASDSDKREIKKTLKDAYYKKVIDDPLEGRILRDLYMKMVELYSENPPILSSIIGIQQPHADLRQDRKYFDSVPSQLKAVQDQLNLQADTMKLAMHKKHLMRQNLNIEGYDSLKDLARHPLYKEILDQDYRVLFFWAHGLNGKIKFRNEFKDSQKEELYNEFYEFTKHLLVEYNQSGKTFMIGNWEGDWMLAEIGNLKTDASPEAIQNMIDWFNIRAKAIADAKEEIKHSNVRIHLYAELNHVSLVMREGLSRIVNSVLPHILVDYVSISSYDMQGLLKMARCENVSEVKALIFPQLDYVESMLPPADIQGKRVFIGEIGYPIHSIMKRFKIDRPKAEIKQAQMAFMNAQANIEWGVLFWQWWALYDNEQIDEEEPDAYVGFGLIDQVSGKARLNYHYFSEYYKWSESYLSDNKNVQSVKDFQKKSVKEIEKWVKKLKKELDN